MTFDLVKVYHLVSLNLQPKKVQLLDLILPFLYHFLCGCPIWISCINSYNKYIYIECKMKKKKEKRKYGFTKDLTGARNTILSSPINWGGFPPLTEPRLDPPLRSLFSHFMKPDFLSACGETKSPVSEKFHKYSSFKHFIKQFPDALTKPINQTIVNDEKCSCLFVP